MLDFGYDEREEAADVPGGLHAGRKHLGLLGFLAPPANEPGYLDASFYAKIGRQLEEGCFDLMFFDDRLAMPGIYGGTVDEAVRYGARPVKLDLGIVLGVLAHATSRSAWVAPIRPPTTRRSTSPGPSAPSTTSPVVAVPGTW